MKEESRKAEIITYEILSYFFEKFAQNIRMSIDFVPTGISIEIKGSLSEKPTDLEDLATLLNVERNYDMDVYYEGLMGLNHELEDYALVGMLTDEVQVRFYNSLLHIQLFRKNTK